MKRVVAWCATGTVVVLAARSLAYALEPSPLARTLQQQAGGPRLWVLAVTVVGAAVAAAAALVWLAAVAVEERRRLERRTVVGVPSRPALGRLVCRAGALFGACTVAFALFESTLHWQHGLGWHGLACVTGPVHRDALPILLALSFLAAAAAAALEHVFAWMRRTLARLRAVRPAPRPLLVRPLTPPLHVLLAAAPLSARGPPVAAL